MAPKPKFVCRIKDSKKFNLLDAHQQNELVLAKKVYGWYNWDDPSMPAEPYLAFSEKSGKAKLSAAKISPLVARVGITNSSSGETEHSLVELRELVASHYQINVGTGYGVSSTLAFLAALYRWNLMTTRSSWALDKLKVVSSATPRAWEHIYEDMMLAGFNQPGFDFAGVLQACVSGRLWKDGQKCSVKETIETLQDAYIHGAGLGDPSSDEWTDARRNQLIPFEQMQMILHAFRLTRGYSALARRRPENFPKHYGPKTFENEDFAILVLAGCFRALSQGVYGAGGLTVLDEARNEGRMGTSPWQYLNQNFDSVKEMLPPWLRKRMAKGMRVHIALAGLDKAKADSEQ
jgi:hypothetical protein